MRTACRKAINAGLKCVRAQLFAESLEKHTEEAQQGGVTVRVHDHTAKPGM